MLQHMALVPVMLYLLQTTAFAILGFDIRFLMSWSAVVCPFYYFYKVCLFCCLSLHQAPSCSLQLLCENLCCVLPSVC